MSEMDYAERMLSAAKKCGADEADVFVQTNTKFTVDVRSGAVEKLTQAHSKGLGLRIFKDGKLGFACTTDFSDEALKKVAETSLRLALVSGTDPANGLPEDLPDLDVDLEFHLYDPDMENISTESKIEMALKAEESMFATDKRIVNSEGCSVSTNLTRVTLLNTNDTRAVFDLTDCSLVCVPVAAQASEMQIAFDYKVSRFYKDIVKPEEVGRKAAELAVSKLGAQKIKTQQCPIILDRRAASQIIAGIFDAVDGDAVHRQMSFLNGMRGKKIAPTMLSIIDDGTRPSALGSAPCDDEGIPTQFTEVISHGVLENFLYDIRTSRKCGEAPTGNGQRSYNSLPSISPSNFYVQPGHHTPEALIANVQNGFWVNDVMGSGVNPISGDVSFGASGRWIENGELTYAVQEVTIAGHLLEILHSLEAIGNDLIMENTIVSPTLLIGEMTVSGT